MKHYFFLDNSDLFVRFLDLSEEELKKKASEVSLYQLQSKLERGTFSITVRDDTYDQLFARVASHPMTMEIMSLRACTPSTISSTFSTYTSIQQVRILALMAS